LRSEAIGAFPRLAKDDPALQDLLVTLIDDPDRMVQFRIWGAVQQLKLSRAYPVLKAQLERESVGFSGFGRRMLQQTLDAIRESEAGGAGATDASRTMAALEKEAADLEAKARDLRTRIAALRPKLKPGEPASNATTAGTGSAH
jgi:hypothetical protein